MKLLGWLIGAGVAAHAVKKISRRIEDATEDWNDSSNYTSDYDKQLEQLNRRIAEEEAEQERRRNTPCRFEEGFSEADFEQMANRAARKIKRLEKVAVDGPIVYGMVQSQSGISDWYFMLDFNDYGHITGTYWCSSDNEDSNIPTRLGSLIQDEIDNYYSQ